MIVLVDDEDRENEGDLIMGAEKVTPEAINFMATHGRGLICLSLTGKRCEELELPLMAKDKDSRFGTAFTVSVDAASGINGGVSAQERSHTILTATNEECGPEDLVRPGHIFPLRAREGGTLVRAGHTEGSIDLSRLAGLKPAGVLCEIMDSDGGMARVPELLKFTRDHGIKLATIADLIEYRRHKEKLIEKVIDVDLPTPLGRFRLHCYKSLIDEYLYLVLTAGDVGKGSVQKEPVLVRVHSECLTGDIFDSLRCDCGSQLHEALRRIAKKGTGALLYMRQEGRGIGLINKLKSYALQEEGLDTVQANLKLGLPVDPREYGIGAQILRDLGIRRLLLLTNNPKKTGGLRDYGLEICEQIPIVIPPNIHNHSYLKAKRDKLRHLL